MPRELITIQVGQCGNQIGSRFWDLALQEHATYCKSGKFDDPLSSFFRNVDTKYSNPLEIPVGDGSNDIMSLKARAVVVDMEEGVVNGMLKSDIGEIFDQTQFITDVSGAGNNWAHGFHHYGQMYQEELLDKIRRTAEYCDSLQSFFLMHSLGGGTGSGVGTFILSLLEDNFEDVFRFTTCVFPSENDDVVTSPYNSIMSLNQLISHSDCVLPIDNQALMDICHRIEPDKAKGGKKIVGASDRGTSGKIKDGSAITGEGGKKQKAFDKMNNIVAHLLNNLTSSMRFEGSLNVDLNEITMNLVPYPKLHFLVSSLSPLYSIADVKMQPRRLDQIFSDAVSKDFQLLKADPRSSTYLACGLMLRGNVQISDINRNINRLKPQLQMIPWNQEGFKVGLCNQPPVGMPYSLLWLSNNSCIRHTFGTLEERFMKLYKHKVYVHHYTEYMDKACFDEAIENVRDIAGEYEALESYQPEQEIKRLNPAC
eukprot:CAMPEP_0114993620 /NCGR_PEP_ID=MMETSP0216-20121206/12637_1 /TAXON_ID=223996 /ORGANISM="Protocruzia adherens, Strain Boccale" /LENGTH=481 /DNA_ID=CAMNT_0002357295 /DNA_START=138 /DNA_END=1583 /DNA_ORIENTATION=+